MYTIKFYKQAVKDLDKIKQSPYKNKVAQMLKIISINPFTPPYEKLTGKLAGAYSRRINKQHRLVYEVYEQDRIIKIVSMWTHYENT